jgi:small-conductance mechanosensitive channel
MQDMLSYSIFDNTILDYLSALGMFICGIAIVYLFKRSILRRLKIWADATDTSIDDLVIQVIQKSLIPLFSYGAFYISLHMLVLSPGFKHGLKIAAIVLATILVVRALTAAVYIGLKAGLREAEDIAQREKQLRGIRGIINIVIWVLALIFLLDNLGVKISVAVAGLGIGGIAVALASQALLGDLFSYFVIFFDKPFEIGDFIIVGDKLGVVEYVGIKTTRIHALSGEQIVFSNTDLTNSRVHNFKKMEKRRVVFKLGVIYQTPAEKLKSIPRIVKDIIEEQQDVTFDRGHFQSFGDFSLNFEFVYYVAGADYNKYMDIQQAINFSINDIFAREKIEFAYPSQTLFVNTA